MNYESPPLSIERRPVVQEIVRVVKEQISSGRWLHVLPAERELSDLLGVSRSSLRVALQRLKNEGLISIQHGKRGRVLAPPPKKAFTPQRKMLLIVSQLRKSGSSVLGTFWLQDFRQMAPQQGWLAVSEQIPFMRPAALADFLQSLGRKYRPSAWLLVGCERSLQEAVAKHGWPALICGTGYPDVPIPSIDVDHRAACRHAVGHLVSLGHRRVGLVVPKNQLPGDVASEAGFLEGLAAHRGEPLDGRILRPDPLKERVFRDLQREFRRPSHPTALIVCRPQLAVTVITCLAALGLQVPRDVSVICREHSPLLHDCIWPSLTNYHVDARQFSRRVLGLCRKLSEGSQPPARATFCLPTLLSGHSVATFPR